MRLRRRSGTVEVREHEARDLLRRVLRSYRLSVEMHPCDGCRIDYDLYAGEARALGVQADDHEPGHELRSPKRWVLTVCPDCETELDRRWPCSRCERVPVVPESELVRARAERDEMRRVLGRCVEWWDVDEADADADKPTPVFPIDEARAALASGGEKDG